MWEFGWVINSLKKYRQQCFSHPDVDGGHVPLVETGLACSALAWEAWDRRCWWQGRWQACGLHVGTGVDIEIWRVGCVSRCVVGTIIVISNAD